MASFRKNTHADSEGEADAMAEWDGEVDGDGEADSEMECDGLADADAEAAQGHGASQVVWKRKQPGQWMTRTGHITEPSPFPFPERGNG